MSFWGGKGPIHRSLVQFDTCLDDSFSLVLQVFPLQPFISSLAATTYIVIRIGAQAKVRFDLVLDIMQLALTHSTNEPESPKMSF